jgi:hypothetical protein
MNEANLLLKAYYEALHNKLETNRDLLAAKVRTLLREEIEKRWHNEFYEEKYLAYQDACIAFIDERIEYYNPIGIQYTFDRTRAQEAFELELQLNWFNSRDEFAALVETAQRTAEKGLTEETLQPLAEELIAQAGAFPQMSIISGYETNPALGKLPDYIVALAIKEIIK